MSAPATRRPVVYLIAQPTVSRNKTKPFDLNPLYDHGEVQVVLPMGDSPTFTPIKCMDVIEKRLEAFDPDIDFLVWAGGDTLAAVMVGLALAQMEIWCFRWLRYERARLPDGSRTDIGAKYTPVDIDLSDPSYEGSDDTEQQPLTGTAN